MAIADPIACLEAGKCLVMTKTTKLYIYGILGFSGFLFVLFFLMIFWTPALIFLKAKIRKSSIIYLVNRAQGGRFLVGKHTSEGIIDVRNVGPFIMTENSHTIEQKSRVGLFFAFGEFAATLPLKWVYVLNKIRQKAIDKGTPITNIDDLAGKVSLKFDEDKKVWKTT